MKGKKRMEEETQHGKEPQEGRPMVLRIGSGVEIFPWEIKFY